jgi:hypothetical protein
VFGEDPAATLDHRGDADRGKQLLQILRRKPVQGLAQKPPLGAEMRQKFTQRGGIGHIASAFAGYSQFESRLVHLFQEDNLCSLPRGISGGK